MRGGMGGLVGARLPTIEARGNGGKLPGEFHSEWRPEVDRKNFCKTMLLSALLAGLFAASSLQGQEEPASMPETKAPAAQTAPAPAASAQTAAPAQTSPSGHPNDAYWTEHDRQLLVDFGGLAHFKEADTMLGAAKTGEDRVVFMGDSITQGWKLDEAFPGKPYVNRGISGQTTPQMLIRFRQDVIDLKPKVVVILAGTNDIAGNTGPMTLVQTEGNLASMAELAAANGIRVVMCSVLPAFDYPWAPGLTPAPKIAQINDWIKNYAAQKGYVYVDFYFAMKDDRGGLRATLSRDGVHPLPAGFAMMTPLAEAGIEKALR
jgi:lysophospholipase L1-like esterase